MHRLSPTPTVPVPSSVGVTAPRLSTRRSTAAVAKITAETLLCRAWSGARSVGQPVRRSGDVLGGGHTGLIGDDGQGYGLLVVGVEVVSRAVLSITPNGCIFRVKGRQSDANGRPRCRRLVIAEDTEPSGPPRRVMKDKIAAAEIAARDGDE